MMLRTFRNSATLVRIALILARHDVLFFWRDDDSKDKGKRLARALEEMGPTFVKLGQTLSTRSDLIGQNMARDLSGLQDKIPAFPGGDARNIVVEQLGKPILTLFASFDNQAVAAASIAQVHFATLHDGREVAVKILRPHIRDAFARDIELFYWLADIATYFRRDWRRFKLPQVVQMFEEMVRFELDLRFEAAAAVELKKNLQNDTGIYVPEVHWELTSEKVLTLERIRGIPISDVASIIAEGHDPVKLVDIAAISFFQQVFRDGYFHADMHPGNMFVLPNGNIAVVDFGIMGRLDKKTRIYLAQILHGFLTEDYYNLSQVHFDAGYVPAHKSVDAFALALMAITKPILGRKLNEISVARLLGQLFTTAETFEMEVQPHLLLLQKNMMISEGVGRMLNPEVNMWQVAEPLISAWAKENLGPRARIKEHAEETIHLIRTLPALLRKTESALSRVTDGGIKLHPETVAAMQEEKRSFHREWLWFCWVALAVFALAYITH
jgi:ubiquinone biosynthesis protein